MQVLALDMLLRQCIDAGSGIDHDGYVHTLNLHCCSWQAVVSQCIDGEYIAAVCWGFCTSTSILLHCVNMFMLKAVLAVVVWFSTLHAGCPISRIVCPSTVMWPLATAVIALGTRLRCLRGWFIVIMLFPVLRLTLSLRVVPSAYESMTLHCTGLASAVSLYTRCS